MDISFKILGGETELRSNLKINNICRASSRNGYKTWRGDVQIGGNSYPAIAYGESAQHWSVLHQVDKRDLLLEDVEKRLSNSLFVEDPIGYFQAVYTCLKMLHNYRKKVAKK